MIKKQITIAIDGYSACGKSTLAKDLAKKAGKSPQTYYNKLNIAKKKILEKLK